jgi:hypothetical protein
MQAIISRTKYRIRTERSKLWKKSPSTVKCSLPSAIEMKSPSQPLKQEEPMISTVREMTMDGREELENDWDRNARTKCSAPIPTIT